MRAVTRQALRLLLWWSLALLIFILLDLLIQKL